ncbi:MAG TPA: hypothetical protein VFU07_04965 [Candidatus Lumbricidophila sp.]|nr:hypothetical protein [Candidatus Lumbricidophila sp.]
MSQEIETKESQSTSEVYLEKFSIGHAWFGGIDDAVSRITIDRAIWNDLGQPDRLTINITASLKEH